MNRRPTRFEIIALAILAIVAWGWAITRIIE